MFQKPCGHRRAEIQEISVIVLTHAANARRRRLPTLTDFAALGCSLTVLSGIGRDTLAAPLVYILLLRRDIGGYGFWLFCDLGFLFGLRSRMTRALWVCLPDVSFVRCVLRRLRACFALLRGSAGLSGYGSVRLGLGASVLGFR
jgi:hypothetical protein